MRRPFYEKGSWNVVCDVCGVFYKTTDIRQRWDGLKVCHKDWETRHPQDFLRAVKDDSSIPWSRPQPVDDYAYICYVWGQSAYSDLAESDCAQADNTRVSFSFLRNLKLGLD